MMTAAELRPGVALRLEGTLYKVTAAEYHMGGGKMGGVTHAKLLNLETGTTREWRFHASETVAEIAAEHQTMQFLYADDDTAYFMHPQTFDQVAVPRRMVGNYGRFLDSGVNVRIEFFGEEPIDVLTPKTVDAVVASTGAAMHGDIDAAPKSATLENGMEVQVPQFIKTGDHVRIEVETGKYVERVR